SGDSACNSFTLVIENLGVVAKYDFEPAIGVARVADHSGNGHDATATDLTFVSEGSRVGSFNGTSSFASTAYGNAAFHLTQDLTISLWMKPSINARPGSILLEHGADDGEFQLSYQTQNACGSVVFKQFSGALQESAHVDSLAGGCMSVETWH